MNRVQLCVRATRALLLSAAALLPPASQADAAAGPAHAELGSPKTAEPAPAAPLADPTRPPPGWGQPVAAAASGVRAAALPPQLASVRIGGGEPASALINGQLVHVGEHVGDAVVAAIDADSATLRTAKGLVRLSLAPEVIKSPTGTPRQLLLSGRKEAR